MAVDVSTDIVIGLPRGEVAAFAADPSNATRWYSNIRSVEWETAPPAQIGSCVRFAARFLGRRLEYTYEICELVRGRRLVMRASDGPFPMETSYEWRDETPDSTRMTLRNRGEPRGFAKVSAPLMAHAMRRANLADLRQLKSLLEGS
jgi:hypothetical protein